MATGDNFLALTNKRLLGYQDFGERWFDYHSEKIRQANRRAFGQDGFFGGTQVTVSVHSGNRIQIDNDVEGADNAGNFLTTDAKLAGRDVGLPFQNLNGVVYGVALHYAARPRGIAINPRTARPDFVAYEETIGELHEPDDVAITGGGTTLTFTVDSTVDPFAGFAVNNAGRKCAVWKKIPGEAATVEAAAVEEIVVTWSGTSNQIVTTSLLGQVDPTDDPSDYQVLMIGPTIVQRSVQDLSLVDGYLFVAEVTGASPPTVFSYTKQNDLGNGFAIELSQITRNDAHGDLKLSVSADGSDVNESQIRVVAAAGTPVTWSVDEDGDVTSEGSLAHAGLISSETGFTAGEGTASAFAGAVVIEASGSLVLESDSALEVQAGSIAQFAVPIEALDGIVLNGDITSLANDVDPAIGQATLAGTASPGANGYHRRIYAQKGQRGNIGQLGGLGGDVLIDAGQPGVPGAGAVENKPGRVVKRWGDSSSYKWVEYEWCSGERPFTTTNDIPLDVPMLDNEIHTIELYISARESTLSDVLTQKRWASFERRSGTVTLIADAAVYGAGTADVAAAFQGQPFSTNGWRIKVVSLAGSGDYVLFVKWRVVTLDGT